MARVGTWFYLLLVVASLLTFAIHEAAHALAGIALGHDMAIGINGVAARAGGRCRRGMPSSSRQLGHWRPSRRPRSPCC
jgi:hypothetical protein